MDRRRDAATPGRIDPLAVLPIFFKLGQRRAVVAGGALPATWKVELLAAAGAHVSVYAQEPCPEMLALADTLADRVTLERRGWMPSDLEGATLAVGSLDEAEGRAFRDAAQEVGVPVNVIDVPPLCDFQFGTIVGRSPLVIGISTDGAAPVLGQALRARIEALLPERMGAWAQAAKDWREDLRRRQLGFAARRRFWEKFADLALESDGRVPTDSDRSQCLELALGTEQNPVGRLLLVGAGPGTPDGLTLGAIRALQSADIILYDPDVASPVLALGRREAQRLEAPADLAAAWDVAREVASSGRTLAWVGLGDGETGIWMPRRALGSERRFEIVHIRGLSHVPGSDSSADTAVVSGRP